MDLVGTHDRTAMYAWDITSPSRRGYRQHQSECKDKQNSTAHNQTVFHSITSFPMEIWVRTGNGKTGRCYNFISSPFTVLSYCSAVPLGDSPDGFAVTVISSRGSPDDTQSSWAVYVLVRRRSLFVPADVDICGHGRVGTAGVPTYSLFAATIS